MRSPILAFPFRIWDYHRPLGMTVAGAAISVLMVLPLAFIASYGLRASLADWAALWSNWLPKLLSNTLKLGFATALFTLVLGTSLAWLVTRYDFPGRLVWSWLLATPLGIPPYIMAYDIDVAPPRIDDSDPGLTASGTSSQAQKRNGRRRYKPIDQSKIRRGEIEVVPLDELGTPIPSQNQRV